MAVFNQSGFGPEVWLGTTRVVLRQSDEGGGRGTTRVGGDSGEGGGAVYSALVDTGPESVVARGHEAMLSLPAVPLSPSAGR